MKTAVRRRDTRSAPYGILAALLLLSGCVSILQPPDNHVSATGTVTAEIGFRSQYCAGTFRVTLDNNDVTSQFNPQPPAATTPQATFQGLMPGQHTLSVSAETLQYWILIPYCGAGSDSVTFTVAAPPLPRLGFAPAGPLTIDAGTNSSVAVTAPSAVAAATTVTLSSNSNRITVPASATINANATSSPAFAVNAQTGGSATVTATAGGFSNGSLSVDVRPVINSLTPASGAPGTSVTVAGAGFDNSASVRFGNQAANTTFVSSTQLTATVPMINPAQSSVTAVVNSQTSAGRNFQVLAPPAPMTTLLFRTSANDVQTFSFASGALTLLDTDAATPQGGTATVGVGFNGTSSVVRTSAADVQAFNVAANNLLSSAGAAAAGSPSGTGAAIAAAGNLVVRASDVGLETYLLVNGVPQRQVMSPVAGSVSATGVAVDIAGTRAVRAHANGIDIYNVANAAAPTLVASAGTMGLGISSTGVGVKFAPGGAVAVRSNPAGIDVYTIAANGTPTRAGGLLTGALNATLHTSVAINAAGTRAVRAHSTGIEVYDITTPAAPVLLGQRAGAASTTGTGAFIAGTTMFRATNMSLEAYDISNPAAIPAAITIAATPSAVGVGLAGR